MATPKKSSKKAIPAKKKAVAKKAPAQKAAAAETEVKGEKAAAPTGDRKALASKARNLKLELLAVRFNVQSPNLNEYRKKRRELAATLAELG